MLDIVNMWEPDVKNLEEFGFNWWEGSGGEEFEEVAEVVAAVGSRAERNRGPAARVGGGQTGRRAWRT